MSGKRPVHHPIFARLYPKLARAMERVGIDEHRAALLAGLSGTVVEVGAGSGSNFRHYPATVTRLVAVEPEPRLRRAAEGESASGSASVPVEVVDGLAERLPLGDGSVDAVVCSLVLCSVRDQVVALREIRRVLAPDGRLHFFEHVRADSRGMVRLQRFMDATIYPLLAGGCHAGRDTTAAIQQAGFRLDRLARFRFPDVNSPTSTCVLGVATPG